MSQPPPELVPIGDAARVLGVSVDTMRRWEREGKISSVRTLGRQRRYDMAAIETLREKRSA